ncbi:TolC family protein [Myroides odoratimimus]|uniref:TolC family protein n=1 Tax=Myroides odoratimimus TaxID=76832 RepID=UPI002576E447|nr:TolC family protein [Myroides odoratimimus]MDM1444388.1 TolC family protein [Myroides odoratimimus]MDM1454383.1 TolC family protein [Myroides odoratimimus]MDM1467951.1 TolC family protein [Myroides odoratimimus]MDM1471260.1 TolC family protein [Myroides odoratimimus]MDM1478106.1 TolC family protein [Myroides odoratimimus]
MKWTYKIYIGALAIGMLASCQSTQSYQHLDIAVKELYRDTQEGDTLSIGMMPWQTLFKDAKLQELITEGIENNLDLKIGIERLHASESLLKQSKAAFLPDLSIGGGVKRSRLSYPQGFGFVKNSTQYDVFANTSWEIDVWGKLASSKRAAYYRMLQSDAGQKAVQTQIVAQIADYYYQLLALDQQQTIIEKTIVNRKVDVETMQKLKESNVVTGAAVVQSEANYYDAEATLPGVKRQIREVENALNVLLGKPVGTIDRANLTVQELPIEPNIGIPAHLLKNRPDVMAAEYELAAYFEDVNAAKRAFYPSLNITGGAGFSSYEFKDWFTSTGLFANIAGGLLQPIFNKRQNKTRLEIAKASYQEKAYNFQKTMLVAGQEVSDALYAYEMAGEQLTMRQQQVDKLALAVDYTKKLLVYHSSTNYTDVLTSEQAHLYAQLAHSNDQLLEWQAIIKLYKALGGGWRE